MKNKIKLWFEAAKNNDSNLITQLIEQQFPIETQNDMGRTALHITAENGSLNVALILLQHGADIEAKMCDEGTPLMDAVACNQFKMVALFLKYKANPFIQDECEWSLMHWAANEDCHKVISILYDHAPSLLISKRWNGITPLHMVSSKKMAEKFIRLGAPIDEPTTDDGTTPLMQAVFQNEVEVALYLVKQGANLIQEDYRGESAYSLAELDPRLYQLHQSFKLMLYPPCDKKGNRIRHRKSTFVDNTTIALAATKPGVNEELIEIHASRRIDLFFYTLIAYFNTGLNVKIEKTHIQHGQGKKESPACHSALLTALWDTTKYAPSHGYNTRHRPNSTSYQTGLLNGTHFEDSLNSTVELDTSVNYFDSYYIEGKTNTNLKMRAQALDILNKVSHGLDPIQGMNLFLGQFYTHLATIKRDYLNKKELKSSPCNTRNTIYKAQFKGTFFNACGFKTEDEKPNTIKLKEDYIHSILFLSNPKHQLSNQTETQKAQILKTAYQNIKQDMDLPIRYQ